MNHALRDARTLDPAELRNIGEFEDAIVAEISRVDSGMALPWKKTHDAIKLRPGEVSVWAGINGHGKSQIISQVTAYNALHAIRCCVASMEWRTPAWALRMAKQIGGIAQITDAYTRTIIRALSDYVWTFHVSGSAKAERILEVFKYARRRYKIEFFVIDNLTKCGFADDDYAGQKKFVEALADFARDADCHVALVAHMRKGESEDHASGKFGVKGSGGITDMAATVFEVWRNKGRERALIDAEQTREPLPEKYQPTGPRGMDAMLYVHKQNATGIEPAVALWFDKASGQFLARDHHRPRPMLPVAGLAHAGSAA